MLSASRGQSIPFWTMATVGVLVMMLFVLNYALDVTWTVRAQNAADSAASATHSAIANVYNEESLLIYAASVDEYRLRALNQAILNTINHNGGCSPTIGGSCEQNYNQLTAAYVQVAKNYADLVSLMGQANQITQGGQDQAARKVFSLINNCGASGSIAYFDCAFAYQYINYGNAHTHGNNATPATVQIVACRTVPWIGGGLLGTGSTFNAVATGASAIAAVATEKFVPSGTNPLTNQPYQADERSWFGYSVPFPSPAYVVDFDAPGQPLEIDVNWYSAVPYANNSTVAAGSYPCAS